MRLDKALLLGTVFLGFTALSAPASLAQDSTAATTNSQINADNVGTQSVDAGKLIGQNVVDANGDKVGEIQSVIVNTSGKVSSVVVDVSGWLESAKLISLPWTDLKTNADGKITSSLTKDAAKSAAGYTYGDKSLSGKVLTENGTLYGTGQAMQTAGQTDQANAAKSIDTSIRNADGSLNASQLIGLKVSNAQNESVGKIGELVLDKGGKVHGVVVDVGGFLGIGTHPVMLKWSQVAVVDHDGSTVADVNISKDNLKQMPVYHAVD